MCNNRLASKQNKKLSTSLCQYDNGDFLIDRLKSMDMIVYHPYVYVRMEQGLVENLNLHEFVFFSQSRLHVMVISRCRCV